MKHDPHDTIRDAIEAGYAGLTGDEYLSGRIIRGRGRRPMYKLRTALTALLLMLMLTGVAFALTPRKYAVEDAGTWTYADGQILYQGAEEKRPAVVLEVEGVRNMAVNPSENILYYITRAEGGGYTLDNVTTYGRALYPSRHINAKYRVIQDFVVNGAIYLLADTSTGKGEIYWLDRFSGDIPDSKLSVAGWENKNTTAFSIWDDVLYAYNGTDKTLAAIDLTTYSLLNPPVMAGELTSIAAGFEQDGEMFVLGISGEKLVAIGVKSGRKLEMDAALPAGSSTLARSSHTLHVADSNNELTASFSITDLSGVEKRQLYIVDGFPGTVTYEYAEMKTKEKYPDVEIIHRWTNGSIDYETEMMSGEPGIDIVCIQDFYATFSPLPQLLKSGAIVDLTDEPEIAALREDYLDIWELVSTNGRQYGVMDIISTDLFIWEVDPALAERIGWEIPQGVWTWDDFDEVMELVIAYNETADKPIKLLADISSPGFPGYGIEQFDSIWLDFYAGTSNYDSPEYIKMLEREQRMAQYDLKAQYVVNAKSMDGNTLFWANRIASRHVMKDRTFICPPAFDADNPIYYASVMPLVINANSQMKEEAVYFLSCLVSAEATRQRAPYWSGVWLKDESLYTSQVDPFVLQMEGSDASERNQELHRFVLEHSVPVLQIKDVWQMQLRELMPSLTAGEITPEEYASIVQRQADMIIGE